MSRFLAFGCGCQGQDTGAISDDRDRRGAKGGRPKSHTPQKHFVKTTKNNQVGVRPGVRHAQG